MTFPKKYRTQYSKLEYENTHFYLDYQDEQWGWNETEERGADTFHPFKSGISDHEYLFLGGIQRVAFETVSANITNSCIVINCRETTPKAYTSDPIDLSKYNKLTVVFSMEDTYDNFTMELDISTIVGECYIGISGYLDSAGNTYARLLKGSSIDSFSVISNKKLGYNQYVGVMMVIGQIYLD